MTQNQRVCYSFTINFYFYNKTYLSVYRFCLIPLPKQTKLKKKLMKKTPKETSKQQQNNLDMLVLFFFIIIFHFFYSHLNVVKVIQAIGKRKLNTMVKEEMLWFLLW